MPTEFIGDVGLVRQVVTNILGNAVKFIRQGHVLTRVVGLSLDSGETDIRIKIEDTGISIQQDKVPYIFCDLHQVEEVYNRQFDGTGLALSITQRLITLMNDGIWVESNQGKGSCFGLQITLLNAGSAEAFITLRTPALDRAFVVDEHPVNRSILSKQLGILGIDVITCSSGAAALAQLELAPDLVLTDHYTNPT